MHHYCIILKSRMCLLFLILEYVIFWLLDFSYFKFHVLQGVQSTGGLFGSTPQPSLFGAGTNTNQMTANAPGSLFGGGTVPIFYILSF